MDEIRKAIRRIYRASNLFAEQQLDGMDLTPTELAAVRSIVFHNGLTQKGLSEHLGSIDKSAVARLVKGLEEKGFITRIPDPGDKRAKLVYPSEKAFQLRLGVIGSENRFYRWLFSSLSSQQLEQFSEFISAIGEKAIAEKHNGFCDIKED